MAISSGTMAGAVFLTALFAAIKKCNNRSSAIIPWKKSASDKDRLAVYIDSDMLKDFHRSNRQELEAVCKDFSNVIGSSSDSMVYKGTVKGGPEIVVISFFIKVEFWTGYHELYYQREVEDLARLNHDNTGKLLGYCRDTSPFTRMLVFQYASNRTLYEHIHFVYADEETSQLSWKRRMEIIIGIARGLSYLPTKRNAPFTISKLNSSAVYLTDDFSPKVRRLEAQGVPTKQAEAITASITEVLNDSLENVSQSFVSKEEMQKIEMVQEASISRFKSEVQSSQDHHFSLLQRETEKLQGDIEKLRSEQKYAIDKVTAGQRLDLNLERGRIRDELANQKAETSNLTNKLDREIHALRAGLEAAKYDVIKYCIGTLASISAVGLAVLRILL